MSGGLLGSYQVPRIPTQSEDFVQTLKRQLDAIYRDLEKNNLAMAMQYCRPGGKNVIVTTIAPYGRDMIRLDGVDSDGISHIVFVHVFSVQLDILIIEPQEDEPPRRIGFPTGELDTV